MGADVNILSNLFLPFGKVRMGCPLGRLGWVLEREGADSKTPCPIWIKSNEDTGRCHLHREWILLKTVLLPILTLLVYHRLAVYDVNALWEFQNLCQGHVPAYEYSSRRIDTCIVSISHNLCYSAQ